MAEKPAEILRVRILRKQTGHVFHAEVGEARNVLAAHGQQLIEAGDAELIRPAAAPAIKAPARKR